MVTLHTNKTTGHPTNKVFYYKHKAKSTTWARLNHLRLLLPQPVNIPNNNYSHQMHSQDYSNGAQEYVSYTELVCMLACAVIIQ